MGLRRRAHHRAARRAVCPPTCSIIRPLPACPQAPLSTPVDDAHSVLKYEIEVENLQFNVEAEAAQARAGPVC